MLFEKESFCVKPGILQGVCDDGTHLKNMLVYESCVHSDDVVIEDYNSTFLYESRVVSCIRFGDDKNRDNETNKKYAYQCTSSICGTSFKYFWIE